MSIKPASTPENIPPASRSRAEEKNGSKPWSWAKVPADDDRRVDPRDENALPPGDEALAVSASVACENGRWIVYLDVVLETGAVRRRVGDWPDERRALVAAREIRRNAARRLPPPPRG